MMTVCRSVSLFFVLGCAAVIPACAEQAATRDRANDEILTKVTLGDRDGSTYDSIATASSGLGTLRFMPSSVFSGFDGVHSFVVPIAIYDADAQDLEVVVDDPSFAVVKPTTLVDRGADNGHYWLVTPKRSGTITLTASSRGRTATATVHATEYTPDRWTNGEARYKSGNGDDPPCTRCHVEGRAVDHSPAALAGANDRAVGLVITSGMKPGESPVIGVDCSDCSTKGKQHRWTVTDEEKAGLVTYLRGLDPHGFANDRGD